MKRGTIFIANEMNLSNEYTMKSLTPALESNFVKTIFIPGINHKIVIGNNFFFIDCQNKIEGRNSVPTIIIKDLHILKYPKQDENDILYICKDIKKSTYKKEKKNRIKIFF